MKSDLTDEDVVKQVQQCQVEPFEILVQRYQDKLTRYGRKFLSNNQDIEEIIQEIFIKAYINIKNFDLSRKFSSWIYRIAHNEFVNALKRKKSLHFFNLDVFLPHFVSRENIEKDIDRKETQELINKSLSRLGSKYKEVLILYYFEDLSYKEISDVLRIPISTVGVRIKRAKSIMKSYCQKYE